MGFPLTPRSMTLDDTELASNNGEVAKTSLHTHTTVARLPGVS